MLNRKNQADLTDAEKNSFVQAVKALKTNGTYDNFVRIHRDTMCRWWQIGLEADAAHGNSAFLPWHREYLRRFEHELQKIDPSVTVPYWDYTIDDSPTSSLWDSNFMGGDGDGPDNEVLTGPFAFSTGEWPLNVMCFPSGDGMNQPLKRAFGAGTPALPTTNQVNQVLSTTPYGGIGGFRRLLEGPIHGTVHVWVGETMVTCSSPNDPVFWLHHANIDRLWTVWQKQNPNEEPYQPESGAPQGHNLNDAMWPWDGDLIPPTPANVLHTLYV